MIPNPYRKGMSPRNSAREAAAIEAVRFINETIDDEVVRGSGLAGVPYSPIEIGLVLGTGWGDVLKIEHSYTPIPFAKIPGFEALDTLEGHARELVLGTVASKSVAILRGRVHMNEDPDNPNIPKMVRLQTDILMHLGVRNLIVTSAVGSLEGSDLRVGDVGVANGFITLFSGPMPLWAGEFCSPEDTIGLMLQRLAFAIGRSRLSLRSVGHVMVHGPHFEGRKYDKGILAKMGAGMVGMSMLPEACVASLYDAKVLGLGFVTDDHLEGCTHNENVRRAKASSEKLGALLTSIVAQL